LTIPNTCINPTVDPLVWICPPIGVIAVADPPFRAVALVVIDPSGFVPTAITASRTRFPPAATGWL
jgi:hypothetical protein